MPESLLIRSMKKVDGRAVLNPQKGDCLMSTHFKRFLKNESGATAIEYALIAGLMAVACITALTTLGGTMKSQFETIESSISGAQPE